MTKYITKSGSVIVTQTAATKTVAFNCFTQQKLKNEITCLILMNQIKPIQGNTYIQSSLDNSNLDLYSTITFHQKPLTQNDGWYTLSQLSENSSIQGNYTKNDILKSTLKAMEYMHSKGITHNDLNEGNIMFNVKTGKCSIIDFGEANYTDQSQQVLMAIFEDPNTCKKAMQKMSVNEILTEQTVTSHADPTQDYRSLASFSIFKGLDPPTQSPPKSLFTKLIT